ncbi:alanyl-tRNA editing protein [archaeon]|nr:alanyl-tRNA editing protein [archaeon]
MTKELFWKDCYTREFDATVKSVRGLGVELDRTAFYPEGGGQPSDTGTLRRGAEEFKVVKVAKENGKIVHEVDKPGLREGDVVSCSLDWGRRHRLMRMHTATHVLCSLINRESGALITGNQLGLEKTRVDLSLEKLDKERANKFVESANALIASNAEVQIKFLPVEEARKLSRLAGGEYEGTELRIVSIAGIGEEPCGGTHVRSTSEIGQLGLVDIENKGKGRKRIYFKILD